MTENFHHLDPIFKIDFSTVFRSRNSVSISIFKRVHIFDGFHVFVGDIFDVDPVKGKLLVELVALPPEREFFILEARHHFGDSDKLSALDYRVKKVDGLVSGFAFFI